MKSPRSTHLQIRPSPETQTTIWVQVVWHQWGGSQPGSPLADVPSRPVLADLEPIPYRPAEVQERVLGHGWRHTTYMWQVVPTPETIAFAIGGRFVVDTLIVDTCTEETPGLLYVDDNAPGDPGPGDPNISDPLEDGTPEHPFDSIQKAVDVAKDGARVIVRPGTYLETVDLLGKSIEINGLNADLPGITAWPVINSQGKDTVVRCAQGENPNCVLTGLVITGGRGRLAGGVLCVGSSPRIMNCLIVGNRVTTLDGGGGGIYCQDSNALFANCTVAGNYGGAKGAALWFKDSQAVVTNSVAWGDDPVQVLTQGPIQPAIGYTDVAGGWLGVGNLNADPLFVKPGYWADPEDLTKVVSASDSAAVWVPGDYHLMSQAGRWDPVAEKWAMDALTSPCIDAGDPAVPAGAEPVPNGGRINIGAYGGTGQASMSADK